MADGLPAAPTQLASPQGASPATSPVPNRGLEAAGLAELSMVVRQLESIASKFPITSDAGKAIRESALKLSKHVPDGSFAPGVEQSAAMQRMKQIQQQAALMTAIRAAGAGAPAGAAAQPAPATPPMAA